MYEYLDLRSDSQKARDRPRNQPLRPCWQGRDAQSSGALKPNVLCDLGNALHAGVDLLHLAVKCLGFCRWHQAPTAPLKKRVTKPQLKQANSSADAWLRQAQNFRGTNHRAGHHDCAEGLKVAKV